MNPITITIAIIGAFILGGISGAKVIYDSTADAIGNAMLTPDHEIKLARVEMAEKYLADGHVHLAPLTLSGTTGAKLDHMLFLTIHQSMLVISDTTNTLVSHCQFNAQ